MGIYSYVRLIASSWVVGVTRGMNPIHTCSCAKHKTLDRGPEYRSAQDLFTSRKRLEWLKSVRLGDHRDAILRSLLIRLESLQGQRELLKSEVAKIGLSSKDVGTLMTIKGIDYYAALAIASEIGDITRFQSAEALCAYAGLVPSVRQSADFVAHGRITKRGPCTFRWILDVVAQVVVRYDNPMRAYYRRLVRRRKKRSDRGHLLCLRNL